MEKWVLPFPHSGALLDGDSELGTCKSDIFKFFMYFSCFEPFFGEICLFLVVI